MNHDAPAHLIPASESFRRLGLEVLTARMTDLLDRSKRHRLSALERAEYKSTARAIEELERSA